MIRKITLENYRGHERTEIPLEQFTLLVGDNGVGKTSVLDAAELVQNVLEAENQVALFPRERRREPDQFQVTSFEGDDDGGWSLAMTHNPRSSGSQIGFVWKQGELTQSCAAREVPGFKSETLQPILRRLVTSGVLSQRPEAIARPSVLDALTPTLDRSGYGLATVLLNLKVDDDGPAFSRIEDAARKVIANLSGISIGRAEAGDQTDPSRTIIADELRLSFTGSKQKLPASVASEGTLLALAVLTLIHQPSCPRIVLLDDLDRGLHPRAQAELVGAIKKALELRPDVQVIATSHSPYLVDSFTADEVVVLSCDENAKVVARRLSEHRDSKVVKTLTTGELLTSSGKDWFGL